MDALLRFWAAVFGDGCAHNWTWPRRRKDGYDWQTCTECGQERRSPMQFHNDPPAAKAA